MPVTKEQFIAEASGLSDTYKPNPDVLERLGSIDLTTVSAPAGMGKDTLIIESGMPRVIGDTIRVPRLNNGVMECSGVDYIFRGNALDQVLGELRRGEYVQIGMGPGRDSFYGSRIASYPSVGPALKDLLTSQIETVRKLPFSTVEAIFVVAPTYDAWQNRLKARGHFTPEDWTKRHTEAIRSLEDGLRDERYVFILNDELSVASRALGVVATTREYSIHQSNRARNAANSILAQLKEGR